MMNIKAILSSDWGPSLRRAAGVLAAIWAAVLLFSELIGQARLWWRRHHVEGLILLGLPGAPAREEPGPAPAPTPPAPPAKRRSRSRQSR